jgi:hypothetical protein
MNWIDNLWKIYQIEPYYSEFIEGEWDGYYIEAKTAQEAIYLRVSPKSGFFIAIPMGWDYPLNTKFTQLELF